MAAAGGFAGLESSPMKVIGFDVTLLTRESVNSAIRRSTSMTVATLRDPSKHPSRGGIAFYASPKTLSVSPDAFKDISDALVQVHLPTVWKVPPSMFANYKRLEKVLIPYLLYVGDRAFYGCSSLRMVQETAGSTDIGDSAFSGCTALKIDVGATFGQLHNVGKRAFYGSAVYATTLRIGDVDDVDDVDDMDINTNYIVGEQAFWGTDIENVVLTKVVVESQAFRDCRRLQSVEVNHVKFIPRPIRVAEAAGNRNFNSSAFMGCDNLEALHIRGPMINFAPQPFDGTGITHVVMHNKEHELSPRMFTIAGRMLRTAVYFGCMLDKCADFSTCLTPVDFPPWDHVGVLERDLQKLVVMPMSTTLESEEELALADRVHWAITNVWEANLLFGNAQESEAVDYSMWPQFMSQLRKFPFVLTNKARLLEDDSKSFFTPSTLAKLINDLSDKALFRKMAHLLGDAFASCPDGRFHPLLSQTVRMVDIEMRKELIDLIHEKAPRAAERLHMAVFVPDLGRPEPAPAAEAAMRWPELPNNLVQDILKWSMGIPTDSRFGYKKPPTASVSPEPLHKLADMKISFGTPHTVNPTSCNKQYPFVKIP